jgi:hypothetical protein
MLVRLIQIVRHEPELAAGRIEQHSLTNVPALEKAE